MMVMEIRKDLSLFSSDGSYLDWKIDSKEAVLDGEFTADDLMKIAKYMKDFYKPKGRWDEYIQYIKNVEEDGDQKTPIIWFDDDHAPIGERVRVDMKIAGLITERDGLISLVNQGG